MMEVKGNFIVQGSYIDIHDNEVVNLSVDKAEVKVDGKSVRMQTENEPSSSEGDLTDDDESPSKPKDKMDVALSIMRDMQPQCTQKVDWLSFYTVLLRRRWVEENVSGFCRMVSGQFNVRLDNHALSRDLKDKGTDYTLWTEADGRILRRKRLAEEFDQRLTEYFKRGREEVMRGVR